MEAVARRHRPHLIVSIFVGELGEVTLDGQVKNIAFALFIFTLGYMSGPSFFASLNRNSLRYRGVHPDRGRHRAGGDGGGRYCY